jgi:4-oxalocrotonate tautomerase
MPIVVVRMVNGRTAEQKRDLVRAVTDALVSTINCQRKNVHVLLEEMDSMNWGVGGQLPDEEGFMS